MDFRNYLKACKRHPKAPDERSDDENIEPQGDVEPKEKSEDSEDSGSTEDNNTED